VTPITDCPYTLRPHQVRGCSLIRAAVLKGHRSPLAVMATGGGKTLLAALGFMVPAVEHGKRVLFLAHSQELIKQPSAKLDEIGLHDHGILMGSHWRRRPRAPIQIATVQTLSRRLDKARLDFDLVITDEAHRATAESYTKIMEAVRAEHPRVIHIGLTATPYRADGQGLGDVFDELVEIASTVHLMEEGFLVPIRTFVGERLDLSGVSEVRGEYKKDEAAAILDRSLLIGHVVEAWHEHARGRSTICFAQSIAHSQHIVERFVAAGVAAEHLDGTTPTAEREAIIARLGSGETTIVSNYGVFVEGFDCPRVSCMIGARATKSRGLWRQMVGRILRPFEDKADAVFLDHANLTDKQVGGHGFVTDPDHLSLRSGVTPGLCRIEVECPRCGVVLMGHPPACPACGAKLRDVIEREVHIPEELAARMIEVTPEEMKERQDKAVAAARAGREAQRAERRADFWRKCLNFWERDKEAIAANIGFSKKWEDAFQKWPEHADFTGFPVRPEYNRDNRRWEWKARFVCKACQHRHNQWQDDFRREYDDERNLHSLVCENCGTCYCPRFDYPLKPEIHYRRDDLFSAAGGVS
jgi:DNA repair protein RadD